MPKQSSGIRKRNTETVDDSEALVKFLAPFKIGRMGLATFIQYVRKVYLFAAYKKYGNSAGEAMRESLCMNRDKADMQWINNRLIEVKNNHDGSNDPQVSLPLTNPLRVLLNSAEVFFIEDALKESEGNMEGAARILKISEKKLLRRMADYKIMACGQEI
jgi:DNA-binding NtrC family response regulator